MKLAVTGKGGVGKTTLSAGLAVLFTKQRTRVIAVDADPDSNLAATLGFPHPDDITPIIERKDLIAERTGAPPDLSGSYFSLNPKVDDIPENCCPEHRGIRLLTLGGSNRKGGSGCLCPENAFLRSLLAHLLFEREDVVILDMEAGIENLTRGTAQGVDALIVVVEPGQRSLETARRIRRLAADLHISRVWAVANKVRRQEDRRFIAQGLDQLDVVGFLPFRLEVLESGMGHGGIREVLDGPLGKELLKLQTWLEKEFSLPV
jgi:CO dehydrogenase maturation factor